MGSQVRTDEHCYLACVYCSTYRAIEDFLKSDTKWFEMLQLGGQVRLGLYVMQTPALWLAFGCVQAEDRVQRG